MIGNLIRFALFVVLVVAIGAVAVITFATLLGATVGIGSWLLFQNMFPELTSTFAFEFGLLAVGIGLAVVLAIISSVFARR